jgi:hypothetical protein
MSHTRHPIWNEIKDAKDTHDLRQIILRINERARAYEVTDLEELRDMARCYAEENGYPCGDGGI